MPNRASKKFKDGRLCLSLKNSKKEARKKKASDLHTEEEYKAPTEGYAHGLIDTRSKTLDEKHAYNDDMFWNEQLAVRINKMQEEHEKSKKVILIDKKTKPQINSPDQVAEYYELSKKLPIPQRPKWNHHMSPKELQDNEKEDFLDWRRGMAQIEEDEGVVMTPFEKNLEVWRQLWRVIERSDVVFIILDSRNPLMFRNQSLEDYIKKHKNVLDKPKQFILLLNKADLLSKRQRAAWAKYFARTQTRFLFFSAGMVLEEVEAEKQRTKELDAVAEALEEGEITQEEADKLVQTLEVKPRDAVELGPDGRPVDPTHIFTREDLIQFCHLYAGYLGLDKAPEAEPEPVLPKRKGPLKGFTPKGVVVPKKQGLVVGMVGYPNVGKSSTINALFTSKKVVVSATPGKTKHFQTLILDDIVTLCDCPGLVFPSFASTREGMICDGILPIANMRDYISPMNLLLSRVKKEVIEMLYNVDLEWSMDEDHCTSFTELVLCRFARLRGTMSDHNKPNQSRAASELLKDYVQGKILYVFPPPRDPNAPEEEEDEFEEEALDDGDSEYETDDEEDEEAEEDEEDLDDAAALAGEEDEESEEGEELQLPHDHPPDPVFNARDEAFNADNVNMQEIYAKMLTKKKKNKKANRDHWPVEREGLEDLVTVMEDGSRELHLDEEDGIVQIDFPAPKVPKDKRRTNRALRYEKKRELKAMGTMGNRVEKHTGYDAVAPDSQII